ncbi:alpha/beta fold hydrolase [Sciscionella sediminilitoris]|uniref:alpha/beta fold hydrolase n=1 Tax=Sciscionella sediminilitoris TaxID=1445613 RepID=UPI0004DFA38F|nr:alpha/beta hydrolase [Sciscionella sp. SE31]
MSAVLPLVFVHGIRLSGACWRQQQRLLPGHRVLAPDLPGHGARRDQPFTLDTAVQAVSEAIDAAGGPVALVGHSLGGLVSIATAARYPDRVAALVGAGCTLVPTKGLRRPFLLAHRILTALPDQGDRFSARVLRRSLPAEVAGPVIEAGIATQVIPEAMVALGTPDPLGDLARYPGRVLFINGRSDHFRLQERRFRAACARGELRTVPGAGHYLPLTHGETFARFVGDYATAGPAVGR